MWRAFSGGICPRGSVRGGLSVRPKGVCPKSTRYTRLASYRIIRPRSHPNSQGICPALRVITNASHSPLHPPAFEYPSHLHSNIAILDRATLMYATGRLTDVFSLRLECPLSTILEVGAGLATRRGSVSQSFVPALPMVHRLKFDRVHF